jgi:hypothetical protein
MQRHSYGFYLAPNRGYDLRLQRGRRRPTLGAEIVAARVTWELDGFDRGHGLQPGQQIARSHGTRGGY